MLEGEEYEVFVLPTVSSNPHNWPLRSATNHLIIETSVSVIEGNDFTIVVLVKLLKRSRPPPSRRLHPLFAFFMMYIYPLAEIFLAQIYTDGRAGLCSIAWSDKQY